MARYHVLYLVKRGELVIRLHGRTWQVYHPQADHQKVAADAVLQTMELVRLLAWLDANAPASHQRTTAHATTAWGWTPSKTRHGLARLVNAGLATRETVTRYHIVYTTAKATPAGPPLAPMSEIAAD